MWIFLATQQAAYKWLGFTLPYNFVGYFIYTGDKIGEDEISIAYKLKFEDANKTLTEEEVMDVFNKIIIDVENKLNAKVRSN